ncbi:MAG: ABC transporter ATP-binding protein [Anaerolineaceae bacterium]|nr:ABC transporter ATP-binding protein [Anaerolineaceae bacterium]
MKNIIDVEAVSFSYQKNLALNNISFQVASGEVVGLLGPNGSGKTTSVRLLNGLLQAADGNVSVLGLDPVRDGHQIRRQAGVLTEVSALYERLTAWQNLLFFGGLHGLSDVQIRQKGAELLRFFDIENRADQRVDTYSKGMKQRLALVRVLLHQPTLLYLDEPTSGLDPEAAKKVIDLMRSFRQKEQRSMLICTHNLAVASTLCDRLLIMKKGQILANGSLEDLRARFAPGLVVDIRMINDISSASVKSLQALPGVESVQQLDAQCITVHVLEEAVIPAILTELSTVGALVKAVIPLEKSLEDVYLSLQEEAAK